jgi:tetratricopeptide (TPR) repeat protein
VKLAGKPYEVHLLAVIVLYVLGFAVYLNSFSVPFVFDDYPNIRDNPSIRWTAINIESLHAAVFESHAIRRPIANISFALNYLAGGYDVKGFHLVNVLIHIVNGVLVYFIALILLGRQRTLTERPSAPDRRVALAALFAAAIFIAHPLQIQAVTYIVQRMTSMATLFYLTSLLFYLLGRQREGRYGGRVYWLAALVCWWLALGSKEIAATLPVIIVLTEYFFFRDSQKTWPGIGTGYLLFAFAATAGVVAIYLSGEPGAAITEQYAGRDFTPGERLLTELRVLVFYLSLMALPYPGRLSLDHSFTISHSLTDPMTTLAAVAILVGLLFAALRLGRRHPTLSFCIMWFLVTLSIESSFIGLELAFEHRLYLPMFAFALAVAYLLSLTPTRFANLAIGMGGLFVLLLASASTLRNVTWQDPAALWADAASKSPTSHRARNNLGRVLIDQGKWEQATLQFTEAIRMKPEYAEPHNNLGILHARAGRFDQARDHFGIAIALNPQFAQAFNNLGVALLNQGLVREAALQLGHAVRVAPGYGKAHWNLSTALSRVGKPREACRHLEIALNLDSTVRDSRTALEGCRPDRKTN